MQVDEVIDTYELAPLQRGMLLDALRAHGSGIGIEHIVMSLHEPLDIALFERAFSAVARRHSSFRTRFRWRDVDEPCQEVLAHVELAATVSDWRDLEPAAAEQRFDAKLRADHHTDFDLTAAPLVRLFVARLPGGESRVLCTLHHILLDGRSSFFVRDWFTAYDAARCGEAMTLPPAPPYRAYIEWHRTLDLAPAEEFWTATVGSFHTPTPLGIAAPKPGDRRDQPFDTHPRHLSALLSEQLREAARRAGVTMNTLLHAAWSVVLHRYSGESDVVFGATWAARVSEIPDVDEMVGLVINTLPMRVFVDDDAEVVPWLQSLRAQQIALRPYEHTPLTAVQTWSAVPPGTPMFDSLVVYDNETLDARLHLPGRTFEHVGHTGFPLAVLMFGGDQLLLQLKYSTERFTDAAIARMSTHLVNVLTRLADPNAVHVRDLDPIGADERIALLGDRPVPLIPVRDETLQAGFARQVAATPHAIALSCDDRSGRVDLSYVVLDSRADEIAAHLSALGVGAGHLVGLRVERGADAVIGMLAILKAGAAYLPLDPVYPTDRITFMLQDADVRVVLTQVALANELATLPVDCICLDAPLPDIAAAVAASPATSGDLAYVMYTSGSSGRPKGVGVTHHNVLRLFAATDSWFGFAPQDVWTLFHSYAFDFSVWEIWGALLTGGRLVVVPHDTSRDPAAFRSLLQRERVTVLSQTPTAFRALIDADLATRPAEFALRYVIFGGEALQLPTLAPWFGRYDATTTRLVNMYGITETTVHTTYRPITPADLTVGVGSVIGVPLPDLRIYLLDDRGRPVPTGVVGEMYIAGAGVADGYHKRPDLTAQRFLDDPFHGGRMYRSGDLARYVDGGELEYLGRIDQQVKIRGFRIELGEIEAAIAQHAAGHRVAVIDREDTPGDKTLVAYLVAGTSPAPNDTELRATLRKQLPEYMVPTHFLHVDALPLTPNGKLDRKALPAPGQTTAEPRRTAAPQSANEALVVAVFREVLDRPDVGVFDNFFDLGGHSLMAERVVSKLSSLTHVELPLRNLFELPTPGQLAGALDALSWAAGSTPPPVRDLGGREEIEL